MGHGLLKSLELPFGFPHLRRSQRIYASQTATCKEANDNIGQQKRQPSDSVEFFERTINPARTVHLAGSFSIDFNEM